jgi:hypothetical protein
LSLALAVHSLVPLGAEMRDYSSLLDASPITAALISEALLLWPLDANVPVTESKLSRPDPDQLSFLAMCSIQDSPEYNVPEPAGPYLQNIRENPDRQDQG